MKPVLSIGMIFKNEIRCLERCMKSLESLRKAIPCELVMADTGSGDGSRAVAEKYADIVFDFPWINDFSAARNSVIDRCSGEWFFTVDADEWLDQEISELVEFLSDRRRWVYPFCGVFIRNYATPDLDGECGDFLAVRMMRMSTGERYRGAIHEAWGYAGTVHGLGKTVLHHDGYVKITTEQGQEKRRRNMELLRKKLEEEPDQLKVMLQCVESSNGSPAYEGYIRQALEGVERKLFQWELFGPAIFRHAVIWAAAQDLPELEEWADQAMEQFPDSPFTDVDTAYALFIRYAERQNYEKAIPLGERYLDGVKRYHAGGYNASALLVSTLAMATPGREDGARAILADAYFHTRQIQKAKHALEEIDCGRMYPEAVGNYIGAMMNLHAQGGVDLSPALVGFWEKTGQTEPKKKRGEACRRAMAAAAEIVFSAAYRAAEDEKGFRHAYTLFLPLAGQCETGNAARILAAESADEMAAVLAAVEDWEHLPVSALARAIGAGAVFPLPEKPLNLEVMDNLAARLAQEPAQLFSVLRQAAAGVETPQALAWVRGLALAAVQTCQWEDETRGMELARTFAEVEGRFLPACYAPGVLREENLFFLPPLHRFGWHCAQAFAALDAGDTVAYTRCLRKGLASCEAMKPMVEFLMEHTPGLRREEPSAELLALAEQVKTVLAAYPADDPAVTALKASPAYQKVAYLIEGDCE